MVGVVYQAETHILLCFYETILKQIFLVVLVRATRTGIARDTFSCIMNIFATHSLYADHIFVFLIQLFQKGIQIKERKNNTKQQGQIIHKAYMLGLNLLKETHRLRMRYISVSCDKIF